MNKKTILGIIIIAIAALLIILLINNRTKENYQDEITTKKLNATVLSVSNTHLTVQDQNNLIYTFHDLNQTEDILLGDNLTINYTGTLNKNTEKQDATVISCAKLTDTEIKQMAEDDSPFSIFYQKANSLLETMTLKEKIGQVLLVGAPEENQAELLKTNPYSGYILYKRDFEDRTANQVIKKINSLQNASEIPLLIAVDEEGGTVVRVGSNPDLIEQEFKSPQELYKEGGLNAIKQDTISKSRTLNHLGINLNLAPVVDVATDPNAYIYYRTLGEDAKTTSEYAKTVIEASMGTGVSYTLKHFPGYGDNLDTHLEQAIDETPYETILDKYLPPFIAGTKAGAEAVLVNHNIVMSIDPDNPASLSASIHNLLRNEVGFKGISITDDLSMSAVTDKSPLVKALLAGNDLLIVTDSTNSIQTLVNAVNNNELDEQVIDRAALRVIAWKYYKGLFNTK